MATAGGMGFGRMGVQAAGHHVTVTDGLDTLQPPLFGELVEAAEDPVEHLENLGRRHVAGDARVVDDVGEHHHHFRVAVGEGAGMVLEAGGDRCGEDAEQEALRAFLFQMQLSVGVGEAFAGLAALAHCKAQ